MAHITISDTTPRVNYTASSSQTAFTVNFPFFADSDLKVYQNDTLKTLTTDYTVTGAGASAGGTMTLGTGATSGDIISILRDVPVARTTDFATSGAFQIDTLNTDLDKHTAMVQELEFDFRRTPKVKPASTTLDLVFPEPTASQVIAWNAAGDGLESTDKVPSGGDSTKFTYSTTTTDADPGSGYVRFNNATLASATIAYIDDADAFANDVTAWVQSFDDVSGNSTSRGRIRMYKATNIGVFAVYKINAAITDATGYTKVPLTYIAGAGSFSDDDEVFISFVAHGEDGTSAGLDYLFSSTTTDSDPGSGYVRLNNGTYSSATAIYIDDADSKGVDVSADVLTWDDSTSTVKGFVTIKDQTTQSSYARFSISGTTTDASGYNKLAVTHIDSNGTITNGGAVSIHFTRTGDKGTTGDTGSTGSTAGTSGLGMTWDNSTADADNGAGKIAWNHATIASATVLYVDDVDDAGATIQPYVDTWDAVTNTTAKGYVQITKEGTTSTYALFKVSGAVTDATGYSKIAVTHVVSNGSFSDGDGVGVQFIQSGNDGSGSLSNVVEDTTPQLGGMLDVNGQALGDGTLELLKFSETGSAINEFTIANAATGNGPTLSASSSSDSNVDINITPLGTGKTVISGSMNDSISSTGKALVMGF